MENIVLILGIITSCTHIVAFIIYNVKYIFGNTKPNLISWFLWAALATLNFFSYKSMSGDFIVSMLSLAGSIMCTLTFVIYVIKGILLKKGKFSLDKIECLVLVMGLIAIFVWALTKYVLNLEKDKAAMWANFLILLSVSIGFITTYRGVLKNPKNEPTTPWFIWSTAFLLQIVVVIIAWNGKYQNFAYPASMLILHFGVGVVSMRKQI
jgi:hypothetical protein